MNSLRTNYIAPQRMPQIHSILKIYPTETSQDDKSMKILKALDDQLDPKYLFCPMNNRCDKSGAD